MKKRPEVGVGVLVVRDGRILLSKRLKVYGYGKLSLPGGHVEFGETLTQCAQREVEEETGLRLKKILNLRHYTEEITGSKHYLTFYLIASCPKNQEPVRTEPTKNGAWGWYDPFHLPSHAWHPTKRLMHEGGGLVRDFINGTAAEAAIGLVTQRKKAAAGNKANLNLWNLINEELVGDWPRKRDKSRS